MSKTLCHLLTLLQIVSEWTINAMANTAKWIDEYIGNKHLLHLFSQYSNSDTATQGLIIALCTVWKRNKQLHTLRAVKLLLIPASGH